MGKRRPINADLPAIEPAPKAPLPKPPAPAPPTPPARRSGRGALTAIAGLVIVAIVFLAAAIVGGGDSGGSEPSNVPPIRAEENATTAPPLAAATNNTTRIGGADPATTGAAVALAVYPSRTPSQRPHTVTLVDETWQAAIAAAVLMAPPVSAPMLIFGPDGAPPPTEQALSALGPKRELRPAAAIAARQAAKLEALRESLFDAPPKHFLVVSEEDPAYAAPAAAWAARSGDPVLYSTAAKLPATTAAVLKTHPKLPVYVLGPKAVISTKVVREIKAISRRVKRVAGNTPAENAVALARYADGEFGWNVNDPGHGFVVAPADAPLNAALSAPLSASGTWGPLLLTEGADKLPDAVREYLLDVKPGFTTDPTRAFYNHIWIVGDEGEISVDQQAEIDELAELTKVGGES
jgi:hypothetical protein